MRELTLLICMLISNCGPNFPGERSTSTRTGMAHVWCMEDGLAR